MPIKFSKRERTIIKAAKEGGKIIKKYFGHNLKTVTKSMPSDFFTRADIESEKRIIKILQAEFPENSIISEECGVIKKKSEYSFVIDPLDGTNNFKLGIPYFSVAIDLLRGDESIFCVIYNPLLDELFCAKKGQGAYKNGIKIHVNKRTNLEDSTIVYTTGYINQYNSRLDFYKSFYDKNIKRILDNWCPTLDYSLLASGHIECVITDDDDIYEAAVGKLIVKEAGGIIASYEGKQNVKDKEKKFIAINNKKLLSNIVEIIKR